MKRENIIGRAHRAGVKPSLGVDIPSRVALDLFRAQPESQALGAEGAIQGWIFQQFLTLLALTPKALALSAGASDGSAYASQPRAPWMM